MSRDQPPARPLRASANSWRNTIKYNDILFMEFHTASLTCTLQSVNPFCKSPSNTRAIFNVILQQYPALPLYCICLHFPCCCSFSFVLMFLCTSSELIQFADKRIQGVKSLNFLEYHTINILSRDGGITHTALTMILLLVYANYTQLHAHKNVREAAIIQLSYMAVSPCTSMKQTFLYTRISTITVSINLYSKASY